MSFICGIYKIEQTGEYHQKADSQAQRTTQWLPGGRGKRGGAMQGAGGWEGQTNGCHVGSRLYCTTQELLPGPVPVGRGEHSGTHICPLFSRVLSHTTHRMCVTFGNLGHGTAHGIQDPLCEGQMGLSAYLPLP